MQTQLADFIKDTPAGKEADAILRTCVHCGFCTATCPTYQLLGDELDGPRGRIYLIKQVLEGGPVTERTRLHLDRCLTCRSCETTCPSGVKYHRLLDIGRQVVEERVPRGGLEALTRLALKEVLPRPWLFNPAVAVGKVLKPFLPSVLGDKIPAAAGGLAKPRPTAVRQRKVLALAGCVQPGLAPNINAAAARVLDRLGIQMIEEQKAGCCGALRFHLNAQEAALDDMRRNIDAWWPHVEAGAEAILMTASGCGAHVKEYGHLLQDDPAYAAKAARIAELTKDAAELVLAQKEALLPLLAHQPAAGRKVAFHSPCTLQHGQGIRGVVEELLAAAGFTLTPVADSHLCCGSAGTYSILQPELSKQLRDNKLSALGAGLPEVIATANIGCLTHLQSGGAPRGTPSAVPVRHWVELLEEQLPQT
ncbi:glycolate oxidase subunit GlcF [Azospira oryzae]|uniref:glycolate oxidase subunit GlcF n=1 Tax=Azospira oryzae TaxID=146939 RepID=UPI001966381E|nr:glycolate oxidase subunit GlcF [Azospira oryzae]